MSRSAGLAILILAVTSTPSHSREKADITADITAEQIVQTARQIYGPPPPEPACAPQTGNEIVVCAQEQDNSVFRVKSSSQLDPDSDEALDDGLPRAPDVAGAGIFQGKPTIGGMCIPGLQACPPPPALIIDLSALPEAPEGSDADLIGKGEKKAR